MSQACLLGRWRTTIAALLMLTFTGLILIPPGWALDEDQASGTDSSEGTGVQVASWALTVPYVIGKSVFALAGGLVGGLGFIFSGGNTDTAKTIWTRSMYGTYIIRPAHLRGEEPVHFFGKAENQRETVPPPAQPASGLPHR